MLNRASKPSILVQTVTFITRTEADKGAEREDHHALSYPVDVEILPRGELERPSGRRFGALVHALLATIELDADAHAISRDQFAKASPAHSVAVSPQSRQLQRKWLEHSRAALDGA